MQTKAQTRVVTLGPKKGELARLPRQGSPAAPPPPDAAYLVQPYLHVAVGDTLLRNVGTNIQSDVSFDGYTSDQSSFGGIVLPPNGFSRTSIPLKQPSLRTNNAIEQKGGETKTHARETR